MLEGVSSGGLAHGGSEENKGSLRTWASGHLCHILAKKLKKVCVHRLCFFGGDNLRELEHSGHGMISVDCSCFDL